MNIKQGANGEPCAVLESSPEVTDTVMLLCSSSNLTSVMCTSLAMKDKTTHDRMVYEEASINTSGFLSTRH